MTLEPPQFYTVEFLIELVLFYHPYVFYNMSMRRILIMIFVLFVFVLCGSIPIFVIQSAITPTFTPSPTSTSTIPPTLTPTLSPFIYSQSAASHLHTCSIRALQFRLIEPFTVLFHPDDLLYVGDQVSFEVISPHRVGCKGCQREGPGGSSGWSNTRSSNFWCLGYSRTI